VGEKVSFCFWAIERGGGDHTFYMGKRQTIKPLPKRSFCSARKKGEQHRKGLFNFRGGKKGGRAFSLRREPRDGKLFFRGGGGGDLSPCILTKRRREFKGFLLFPYAEKKRGFQRKCYCSLSGSEGGKKLNSSSREGKKKKHATYKGYSSIQRKRGVFHEKKKKN